MENCPDGLAGMLEGGVRVRARVSGAATGWKSYWLKPGEEAASSGGESEDGRLPTEAIVPLWWAVSCASRAESEPALEWTTLTVHVPLQVAVKAHGSAAVDVLRRAGKPSKLELEVPVLTNPRAVEAGTQMVVQASRDEASAANA